MNCKICESDSLPVFKATVLNKYFVQYYQCSHCGFIQTEKAYWLKEAYTDAISSLDTGIMKRNIYFSQLITAIIGLLKKTKGTFLDYGGGLGIFTRLMRDRGLNFFWYDLNAHNYLAHGFEGSFENSKYDMVTAFECFEHFENPLDEIEKILSVTDTLFFTTELAASKAESPDRWWYYCLEHGQHISLYTEETLRYLASKYNLNLTTNKVNLHILSRKPISGRMLWWARILTKLKLDFCFNLKSKTIEDMHYMILKLKKDN